MTEKEASLFLAAYKNRERSGSIQIPSENIELKPDGHLVVKVKCNSEKEFFKNKNCLQGRVRFYTLGNLYSSRH